MFQFMKSLQFSFCDCFTAIKVLNAIIISKPFICEETWKDKVVVFETLNVGVLMYVWDI